jgi:hypothetical protein
LVVRHALFVRVLDAGGVRRQVAVGDPRALGIVGPLGHEARGVVVGPEAAVAQRDDERHSPDERFGQRRGVMRPGGVPVRRVPLADDLVAARHQLHFGALRGQARHQRR